MLLNGFHLTFSLFKLVLEEGIWSHLSQNVPPMSIYIDKSEVLLTCLQVTRTELLTQAPQSLFKRTISQTCSSVKLVGITFSSVSRTDHIKVTPSLKTIESILKISKTLRNVFFKHHCGFKYVIKMEFINLPTVFQESK